MVKRVPATWIPLLAVVLLLDVPSPPVPLGKAPVSLVALLLMLTAVEVPTVTLMVTAELLPATIGLACVQVTTWGVPVALQLHPVPLPLVKVRPAANVSVIVRVGNPVGPGPLFVAVIVNDAGCPRVKIDGECVIGVAVSEMSGRFSFKFTHQPASVPSGFSSLFTNWNRLQVPLPLKVLLVVPPKTPDAPLLPRIEVPPG